MLRYRVRMQYGEDETEEMCLLSKLFYIEKEQSTRDKTNVLRVAWERCLGGLGRNTPEYVLISLELWGLEYRMFVGYEPQTLFGRSVEVYDKQVYPRLSNVPYQAASYRSTRDSVGQVPKDK